MATTDPRTLDITTYQSTDAVRERNRDAQKSEHTDECLLCLRGLTEQGLASGWWAHMRNDWRALPIDADDALVNADGWSSQGWFPLGSECAKRLPATHRQRGL